ncbi:unnamed protein product [Oreochromis niloticus]|nr:unnamed protein product [Mustela putorius furo]
MAKQTVPTVCILLVLFITVFAQVIVGGNFYNDCPGIPFIPIYLCGAFFTFIALCICGSCNLPCLSVTTLFFICWYIAGNAVIYSYYEPDYSYCNKTLYLFAFWSTNMTNVLLFMLLCCCHGEDEAENNIDVQV